jgi:carbamoyltransferase
VLDWPHTIHNLQDQCDIAAAVQRVFEEQLQLVLDIAYNLTKSTNLVYMGGCAMNSVANKKSLHNWERVWSLPSPGDPSSAVGAILWKTKQRIVWGDNYSKHIEIKG